MTIQINLGGTWYPIKGRTYPRAVAISVIRASKVPARVINEHGMVIACRVL